MSVLDHLPAGASAEETVRVCLVELARSATERGLLGMVDRELAETALGALDDMAAEADRLAEALTEEDRAP